MSALSGDPFANRIAYANNRANALGSLDTQTRLSHWITAFEADEQTFASKAVFVELRLRQALASSAALGVPNSFRAAIVCDAFERVAPLTGRFEGVLGLVWRELVRCLFLDYSVDLPGSGAKVYAERTPYFVEAERLQQQVDELKEQRIQDQAKSEAEAKAAESKGNLLSKTLGKMNRALGIHQGMSEVEVLKAKMEGLEKLLADALAEVAVLKAGDPVEKLLKVYEGMSVEQQEEALTVHIFPTAATASAMSGRDVTEVGGWVAHFLSSLPHDASQEDDATPAKVALFLLATLPDEARLAVGTKVLTDCYDSKQAGDALGNVLSAHAATGRHVTTVRSLGERLNAYADADYTPAYDDPKAVADWNALEALRKMAGITMGGGGAAAKGVSPAADPAASAAAAAAKKTEALAVRGRVEELKRKAAAGELSEEEKKELQTAEAKLNHLEVEAARFEAAAVAGFAAAASSVPSDPAAAEAEAVAVRERVAELKRREAAGELSEAEKMELQVSEAKLAKLEEVVAGGISDAVPSDPVAAEVEAAKLTDRVAELKRKQEAGELSEAEAAELEKSEKKLAKLGEAKKSRDRVAELQEKKKNGKLTKAEKAELAKEEKKLAELEAGSKGGGGGGGDNAAMAKKLAEMERQHAKEMEEEARRMAELMEKLVDPNLSEEDRRALIEGEKTRQAAKAEERSAKLEKMEKAAKGGKVSKEEAAAAEKEAKAVKSRVAELKRKQAAGELSEEEKAELSKAESKLAELEETVAAGKSGGKRARKGGGGGSDGGVTSVNEYGIEVTEIGIQAGNSSLGRGGEGAQAVLGLKWIEVGGSKPSGGVDVQNEKLAAAINVKVAETGKVEFTKEEFNSFALDDLALTSYVQVALADGSEKYFKPVMVKPRSAKLPDSSITSLGEIRFTLKSINAMNVLMCRRLVAAIYQVKSELNLIDMGGKRQSFSLFVPEQFTVLYGIKSIAFQKLCEFFYGVRECRMRKNAKGEVEDEPILYFFWTACHHGVPFDEQLQDDDFDFFIDLLAMVARTAGEEHTLKLQGAGAFWNLLGSMAEIQLPAFVLVQALQRLCGPQGRFAITSTADGAAPETPSKAHHGGHPELFERLKKITLHSAAEFWKASKVTGRKAMQPAPSYKPTLLGAEHVQVGFLPLESFLSLCLEGMHAQRAKDSVALEAIWSTWEKEAGETGFDTFADMLEASMPSLPESEMLNLFAKATSGEDPDVPSMALIENELRKLGIVLRRHPRARELEPGELVVSRRAEEVASDSNNDAAAKALGAFAVKPGGGLWKRAASSKLATDIHQAALIRNLFGGSGFELP